MVGICFVKRSHTSVLPLAFLFAFFLGLASPISPSLGAETDTNPGKKWSGWWEFGGYYNSDDDSRGEVVLFAPLMQGSHTLFFADVRAKFFEDDVVEGNVALGYRQMTASGFNLGAWIGGDGRDTELDNRFWQLSGGFEALSANFDARLNWYGPITDPKDGGAGLPKSYFRATTSS